MKPTQSAKLYSHIIFANNCETLNDKINDWLECNNGDTIIDMQYSVAMTADLVDIYSTYSVLIIYRKVS